ncbi:hypothetical protein CBR_g41553 [Chara braunii]|uniref:Uncharacterized protein n=1 Tax=Chara braunii TaxID=69332 RepID=A0A388K2S1_CHABU|nr:hypothetical protein CBR_g41553 [Chara braunii]|eukprot:GBG64352.1 hypothetical protein CBR_g41553 [Chara braunii]
MMRLMKGKDKVSIEEETQEKLMKDAMRKTYCGTAPIESESQVAFSTSCLGGVAKEWVLSEANAAGFKDIEKLPLDGSEGGGGNGGSEFGKGDVTAAMANKEGQEDDSSSTHRPEHPDTVLRSDSLDDSLDELDNELVALRSSWAKKAKTKGKLVIADIEIAHTRVGALLDPGSTQSYTSEKAIQKLHTGLKVKDLPRPITSMLVDKSTITSSQYVNRVKRHLRTKEGNNILHEISFLIEKNLPFDMILGMDWREEADPEVEVRWWGSGSRAGGGERGRTGVERSAGAGKHWRRVVERSAGAGERWCRRALAKGCAGGGERRGALVRRAAEEGVERRWIDGDRVAGGWRVAKEGKGPEDQPIGGRAAEQGGERRRRGAAKREWRGALAEGSTGGGERWRGVRWLRGARTTGAGERAGRRALAKGCAGGGERRGALVRRAAEEGVERRRWRWSSWGVESGGGEERARGAADRWKSSGARGGAQAEGSGQKGVEGSGQKGVEGSAGGGEYSGSRAW